MVGDLRQRIESIDCREHLAPLLRKECLGSPADGLAVVDHQDLEALKLCIRAAHVRRLLPDQRLTHTAAPASERGNLQPHAYRGWAGAKRSAVLTYRYSPGYATRVTFLKTHA